jgi:hypothetical protein
MGAEGWIVSLEVEAVQIVSSVEEVLMVSEGASQSASETVRSAASTTDLAVASRSPSSGFADG